MSEMIFEVREDAADGGSTTSALGYGIHTQAEGHEELRVRVPEAVECYFENAAEAPKLIRLHFIRAVPNGPQLTPALGWWSDNARGYLGEYLSQLAGEVRIGWRHALKKCLVEGEKSFKARRIPRSQKMRRL